MYFDSWVSFLEMGGHGVYVWSAYGVALLVVAYNLFAPLRAKRQLLEKWRRRELLDKAGNVRNRSSHELGSNHGVITNGELDNDDKLAKS